MAYSAGYLALSSMGKVVKLGYVLNTLLQEIQIFAL